MPQPGPGEVRVTVKAAGLNHLDTWVRRGVPGHAFPLPMVPGCDGAGVVDALGARRRRARRVGPARRARARLRRGPRRPDGARARPPLARPTASSGRCATAPAPSPSCAPWSNVLPLPDSLDFRDRRGLPARVPHGLDMVVRRAALQPGETILIHAAGSGVSTAAIQIARFCGAGLVLASTSSAGKAERARRAGRRRRRRLHRRRTGRGRCKKLTGGRGVDVVVDHVGQATFEGSLRCLRQGGPLRDLRRDDGSRGGDQPEPGVLQVALRPRLHDGQPRRRPPLPGARGGGASSSPSSTPCSRCPRWPKPTAGSRPARCSARSCSTRRLEPWRTRPFSPRWMPRASPRSR